MNCGLSKRKIIKEEVTKMNSDCILIGFHDEPLETILKRVDPYKSQHAGYKHMLARSAFINGRPMKLSEIVIESISNSIGIPCDLSNYRMPSLAIHYIAHYLRKRGIKTELINFFNFGKGHLVQLLRDNPPRCVGITST